MSDHDIVAIFERLLKTHTSDVTAQFREENQKLHARLDVAHDKLNTALVALSHVIPRINDMTAIHDQIAAALSDNDALIAGVQTSAQTLEALKDDSDSKSADLLSKVQAQGSALKSIKSALDAAVEVEGAGPAGADAGTVAADGSAAISTDPVTTSGTLPSGAPVTTTVDPVAGNTQAVVTDPATGVAFTTTVQHDDGSASTIDPSGTQVATSQDAVQAAVDAAAAQGVTVPVAG